MLLYLALSYFNGWSGVGATPTVTNAILPASQYPTEGLSQRAAQSLLDATCICRDTRTIWDIIWGCLATIFACSWVSMHPNISSPNESNLKGGLRRIELMIWALIAPEIVIFWAVNQWSSARAVEEKYKDRGWTRVHGYFIQMGGFMLYEGEEPKGVLTLARFEELLEEKKIDFPLVLEEDIKDKSKGDGLAKALVLLQTTWFVIQCIARRAQNLDIAELELLTVALAVLNGAMYMFWWNKPLNVGRGFPIYIKQNQELALQADKCIQTEKGHIDTPTFYEHKRSTESLHATGSSLTHENQPKNINSNTIRREDNPGDSIEKTKSDPNTCVEKCRAEKSKSTESAHHQSQAAYFTIPRRSQYRRKKVTQEDMIRRSPLTGRFMWYICAPFIFVDQELVGMMVPPEDGEMRVPTFHASQLTNQSMVTGYSSRLYFIYATAMIFGGIHCAGWSYIFPSIAEKMLWRVSSVVITAFPALAATSTIISSFATPSQADNNRKYFKLHPGIRIFVYQSAFCAIVAYVIARLCLLTVALASLRNLPDGAYDVVQWTTFIPHI